MKVLFLSGRESSYPRNEVLLRALKRLGKVEVIGEKSSVRSITIRSLQTLLSAFPRLVAGNYNLIFVGFYGHLLMLPTGFFSRAPVVFDAFVSTYDTMVNDREIVPQSSPVAGLAKWLDRRACQLADQILLDTHAHVRYFSDTLGVSEERLNAIPVGCNEDIFFPRPKTGNGTDIEVLYYCTYLPLHGVEHVIGAAELLKSEGVHFTLIGEGGTYARMRGLSERTGLSNITFVPSVPLQALPEEIARADICLGGHFGLSGKAGRVIPGKIYQLLAMARPIVATTTLANEELLTHGVNAYLCPPGDAEALASAIMDLSKDRELRSELACSGRRLYEEACSEAAITGRLRQIMSTLLPVPDR